MEGKDLKSILDEGGFVDYRDVFRDIERNSEFDESTHWDDSCEDYRDEEMIFLKGLVAKKKKRKKRKSKKH